MPVHRRRAVRRHREKVEAKESDLRELMLSVP
jgi:hypothetical protein